MLVMSIPATVVALPPLLRAGRGLEWCPAHAGATHRSSPHSLSSPHHCSWKGKAASIHIMELRAKASEGPAQSPCQARGQGPGCRFCALFYTLQICFLPGSKHVCGMCVHI